MYVFLFYYIFLVFYIYKERKKINFYFIILVVSFLEIRLGSLSPLRYLWGQELYPYNNWLSKVYGLEWHTRTLQENIFFSSQNNSWKVRPYNKGFLKGKAFTKKINYKLNTIIKKPFQGTKRKKQSNGLSTYEI